MGIVRSARANISLRARDRFRISLFCISSLWYVAASILHGFTDYSCTRQTSRGTGPCIYIRAPSRVHTRDALKPLRTLFVSGGRCTRHSPFLSHCFVPAVAEKPLPPPRAQYARTYRSGPKRRWAQQRGAARIFTQERVKSISANGRTGRADRIRRAPLSGLNYRLCPAIIELQGRTIIMLRAILSNRNAGRRKCTPLLLTFRVVRGTCWMAVLRLLVLLRDIYLPACLQVERRMWETLMHCRKYFCHFRNIT